MLSVIIGSVILGIILTLLIQYYVLRKWFLSLPNVGAEDKPQFTKYEFPQVLLDAISDPEVKSKKETCICLNLLFQFIFDELKDTKLVRRWIVKKMNVELAELLQTTTGKLMDQITVRDFGLGGNFPIVKSATLQDVKLSKENKSLDEVALLVDLTYGGGFQLAVDVDLVFNKSAYLFVKVTRLEGTARIQFSRLPYTHWSFSFVEDPIMEFEVESQLEGRPIPQIVSLIINQIRRSVRKKHTLPNYKMRYKPFFRKPEDLPPVQDIHFKDSKISTGHLKVTIMECSRLLGFVPDGSIYLTLAVDAQPWKKLISARRKLWVSHDIEILRNPGQPLGLSFKDEFVLDKFEELVVVDVVTANTPASAADIRKNDVIMCINGTKITNSKQAAKLIKQTADRILVRIERAPNRKGPGNMDIKVDEKQTYIDYTDENGDVEKPPTRKESFVNICVTQVDDNNKDTDGADMSVTESLEPVSFTGPSSPKRSSKIRSGTSGLFHRKKTSKAAEDSKAVGASHATSTEAKTDIDGLGKVTKPRSKSEGAATLKEVQAHLDHVDTNSIGEADSVQSTATASISEGQSPNLDIRKSKKVKAAQYVTFDETFEFDVENCQSYLNVCMWCKIPEKLDKQLRVLKPEKDVLLGHVSISLMDVALECLTTLQGSTELVYKLTPADTKATAARSKLASFSSHSGFDETLCYGDVRLAFTHNLQSHPLTGKERKHIEKVRQANEVMTEQKIKESQIMEQYRQVEEGKHNFVPTHLQAATYCKFCHKKIWFKGACMCRTCGMICHKKCMEKCQAQTICSKEEGQVVEVPAEESPKSKRKSLKDDKPPKDGSPPKTSLLTRFRKDGVKGLRDSSPSPNRKDGFLEPPVPSNAFRRRNSAPGDPEVEGEGHKNELGVSTMPRTRSSTSLSELIQQDASPSLPRKSDAKNQSAGDLSSSDSGDEMNFLKKFGSHSVGYSGTEEHLMTAAKEMGKELYAHLEANERRHKLDAMVNKLQSEIDIETDNRAELVRSMSEASDSTVKTQHHHKIEKSDEKIQALALLMLHYCSGLQHCMEEQEDLKTVQSNFQDDSIPPEAGPTMEYGDSNGMLVDTSEPASASGLEKGDVHVQNNHVNKEENSANSGNKGTVTYSIRNSSNDGDEKF